METFAEQSVPALTDRTRQFAIDREWLRYHTPRNLLLALMGELGELAEIFQFKGDDDNQSLSVDEQDKVAQEIADVTIYLFRLADVCGVSLKDELKRLE
jgi:dCTP diphosphatase